MQNVFGKSEKFTMEYCCSIVRIGEVKPIEGSDFLATTLVNGEQIVVRKDQVKDGDVWAWVNDLMKDYIPNGMTIYGEAYGYVPNTDKMIQANYDYGCRVGETKIMPYRITTENEDGTKREWNVQEVLEWTKNLIEEHPVLHDTVEPIDVLYHGTLADLYPELDTQNHWHENLLEVMSNDKNFLMEKNEPKCKFNKVPREGIVLRKENDPVAEAFKLKCNKFLDKERLAIDNGEVDMEMEGGYGAEE